MSLIKYIDNIEITDALKIMLKINMGSNLCLILNNNKCVIIKKKWHSIYQNNILSYFEKNYFLNPDNLTIIYEALDLLFDSIKHKMERKNNIYKYKGTVKYLNHRFKIALEMALNNNK